MEILRKYGSTDPIVFPLLDPVTGGFLSGLSFIDGDWLIKKNAAGTWGEVTNLPVDIGAGYYVWTPAAADLQAKIIILKGWDSANYPAFTWAEQSVIIVTGGDPSALFYAT